MLENGWVLNVDRDYAEYCGAGEPVNEWDDDDYRFEEFVEHKNMWLKFAGIRDFCGSYSDPRVIIKAIVDREQVILELLDRLREIDPEMPAKIGKFVKENYPAEFNEFAREVYK